MTFDDSVLVAVGEVERLSLETIDVEVGGVDGGVGFQLFEGDIDETLVLE